MNNPFTSSSFTSVWTSHFRKGQVPEYFKCIENLSFVKKNSFPTLYVNVGQNHTKGISYNLENTDTDGINKKVWLIYDIPEYFDINTTTGPDRLGIKTIKQYPGYLIDLKPYESLAAYLAKNFGKSSRYKLKKYRNRLESSFNIRYKMFYGSIEANEYEAIFECFRSLLEKRFSEKKTRNNNLEAKEWAFMKSVSLPMILEKKAGLFVVYDGEQPISVTLNFMDDTVIFDAITTFDIDYSKFNLGYINIMALIEWGLGNGFETLDFSKGYFDYKERWATKRYTFEYHILYDKKNPASVALANTIFLYFKTKQKLREWQLGDVLNKTLFYLKSGNKTGIEPLGYEIEVIKQLPNLGILEKIEKNTDPYETIREALFSFLYLNSEHIQNVSVYKESNSNTFFLKGKETMQKIVFHS